MREARLEKNLSQRELALRIGKSPTYISYVETGLNPSSRSGVFKPGVEAVDRIAKALDIPVDSARIASGYAPTEPDETHNILDGVVLMFMREADLTPEQKTKLMEVVKLVAHGLLNDTSIAVPEDKPTP